MVDFTSENMRSVNFVIVDCNMGSKILEEAKHIGVRGGTILLGRGAIRNPILVKLGIDECRKEIVMMITPRNMEDILHDHLKKKFHMNKPNHGIIFSIPVNKIFGTHESNIQTDIGGIDNMHEAILTIVEIGLAQDVIDIAAKAGSTGATVINARGSGIHEHEKFFGMTIEPEKEVVIIIALKHKVQAIVDAIRTSMDIDQPGKGIIFTMDVNRVTGIYEEKK